MFEEDLSTARAAPSNIEVVSDRLDFNSLKFCLRRSSGIASEAIWVAKVSAAACASVTGVGGAVVDDLERARRERLLERGTQLRQDRSAHRGSGAAGATGMPT